MEPADATIVVFLHGKFVWQGKMKRRASYPLLESHHFWCNACGDIWARIIVERSEHNGVNFNLCPMHTKSLPRTEISNRHDGTLNMWSGYNDLFVEILPKEILCPT